MDEDRNSDFVHGDRREEEECFSNEGNPDEFHNQATHPRNRDPSGDPLQVYLNELLPDELLQIFHSLLDIYLTLLEIYISQMEANESMNQSSDEDFEE